MSGKSKSQARRRALGRQIDKVFELDSRIRFVAVYQDQYMLAGGMRSGVQSFEPEEQAMDVDLRLAKVGEIANAWQKWFGNLDGIVLNYARLTLAFTPLGQNRFLVLSSDPGLNLFDVVENLRQDRTWEVLAEGIP